MVSVAIAVVITAIFAVNLPDIMGTALLTWNEKTNIVLTFVIAMFAVIEGYSAYSQVKLEKKKYAVQSISDELEKAYGPINAILSKYVKHNEKAIVISLSEKAILDEKLSSYRCLFSSEIIDYWEKNIRKMEISWETNLLSFARNLGNPNFANSEMEVYKIPIEFVNMFSTEYRKKIEKQREILTN
jgi:hypothetical protein